MKKLITLTLCAMIAVSLTGCSGEEKYDKPDEVKAGAASQFETATGTADKTGQKTADTASADN